jgi:hypothetical protein
MTQRFVQILAANRDSLTVNFTSLKPVLPVCKGKGKAIPLQAWTIPEDPRRLRLPDFKTIGT